jgi:chromosome segregation ATPase
VTNPRYQKLLTTQLETTEKAKIESERAKQASDNVKHHLEAATQEYEKVRQLVDKAIRELRDVEGRKADVQDALLTLEQKTQFFAEKSAQLEKDKSRLEMEIETLRERVEKFGGKELEKQQSLAQVTTKILDASTKLNAAQEALATAEREVAEAHHRAERKKLELADLERQVVDANRQVYEWREKSAKVRDNLDQLQRKSEEGAEEREAAAKKLGSVFESVAQANLQIATKNEELRQSTSAVSAAKRELDSVNADLERAKAELKKLGRAELLNWEVLDMEKEIERRREDFQRFMRDCADKESVISSKMAELDEVVCFHFSCLLLFMLHT